MKQRAFRFKDSSNGDFASEEDWLMSQVYELQTEVEVLAALIDGVVAHILDSNQEEISDED